MCLQDLQLARSLQMEQFQFNPAGAGSELALAADNARVGFLILGPNTGTVDVYLGAGAARNRVALLDPTLTTGNRVFSIHDFGLAITQDVYLNSSVASQVVIVHYRLPPDYQTLQNLATYGMYGK